MRVALLMIVAIGIAVPASAHDIAHELTAPGTLSPWDLLAIAALVGMATLYAVGSVRLARRGAMQRTGERLAFWTGWLALLVSILPPLDGLALQLLSAHMVQHELMMVLGAPLLMVGRPLAVCLWGLPVPARLEAVLILQGRLASGFWRALTLPVVAWSLHGLVVWMWHLPSLYEWAVRNEAVHAAQHLMFISTSALFWWGLIYGRYGRAGYGAAVFFVFTTAVHTGILGALLTFAGVPLYDSYIVTSLTHHTDPVADQQVAGLLMWVPAGIVMTLMGLALFIAWMGESDRRARQASRQQGTIASGTGLLLALLAVLTSACSNQSDDKQIARGLTGGDPDRGRQMIHNYGCDSCHTIPGVLTAVATVGPPLTAVGRRTYLAGRLENTPENLMHWIKHPRSVDEKTAMPETGVNDRDVRDIAAYLYTLR